MTNFLFQHNRAGAKSRLWSARIRLGGWLKPRTFPLHVSDKRVAQQKLTKLIEELEREAAALVLREFSATPRRRHC